ncbi:MAG: hypothetical protein JJU28_17300 [Cyclobacteriaceae bacterium]|nr:hypothetical protein [Cyclobacteriaceae bacterium]
MFYKSLKKRTVFFLLLFLHICYRYGSLYAQPIWSSQAYPDETGYKTRIAGHLIKLSNLPFGEKSMSKSTCPDTGRPVLSWALEGEMVYSPYTGRAYRQGPTGYFGALERDQIGRISKFGGDALKKDLIPVAATMMLYPGHQRARDFLYIPGHLQQQYHFAAKNWARIYPALIHIMDSVWHRDFQLAVATYEESQRPSDGYREYPPMSVPHNLVGEVGQLLGGNPKDGGTENHKTMWRSTALIYSQYLPDTALISGYPAPEVRQLVFKMLQDYVYKMLHTGNGEYDSQIYYPHSIEAFLNLYDYSVYEEIKELAKIAIDYYLATYGIKTYDGAIAGAQKRGPAWINGTGEMRSMLYGWFGSSHAEKDTSSLYLPLHQVVSEYRPNPLIWRLVHKELPTPFEMKIARPFYHMDRPNAFQEYFYASQNFGIGSIYQNRIDNPNQQVLWSAVCTSEDGPLTFAGGQPFYRTPGGHSPYTQTLQYKQAVIVAAGQTAGTGNLEDPEFQMRQKSGAGLLQSLEPREDFYNKAQFQEAVWLFIPKKIKNIEVVQHRLIIDAGNSFVVVTPSTTDTRLINESDISSEDRKKLNLDTYYIWMVQGKNPAYAMEIFEKDEFSDLDDIKVKYKGSVLNVKHGDEESLITFVTHNKDRLEMKYRHLGLRADGKINGSKINFKNWAGGAAYESPYLSIKNGRMHLSDGRRNYKLDYTKQRASYSTTNR